ncbi:MAG: ribokinase [Acidimicrobiales bacterium]|nr:ribokinase [Acidimicrobiales bacterium]
MTPEITVVGSANLDLVVEVEYVPQVGETVLGGDLARIPGGKGANQAVAAARLGRRVAMVGRLGADSAGNMLRAALEAHDIDTTSLLTTRDTPNGVAMIAVAADGDNSIVVSPGANGRVTAADVETAGALVRDASVVLLQLEIPLPAVEAAARAASGRVILNPAPAVELPASLLEHVNVLVPNQTELAILSGHDGPVDASIATELARRLPMEEVVVTLGAEGAMVVTPDDAVHVPAPQVTPVDTTGAGDAFCAALADGLVRSLSLVDATAWAVQVGAVTTLRQGAQPSLPTPTEVRQLLA